MGRKLIGLPRVDALAVTRPGQPGEDETSGERESGDREEGPRAGDPSHASGAAAAAPGTGSDWIDNVKDAIPIEVVTAWIAIDAILMAGGEPDPLVYGAVFVVVLAATGLHMWTNIELPDPERAERLGLTPGRLRIAVGAQIALSMGAFVVWAYYLGGPLAGTPWHDPTYAAVALVLYTLLGPQLVPDLLSKVFGIDLELGEGAIDVDQDEETPT